MTETQVNIKHDGIASIIIAQRSAPPLHLTDDRIAELNDASIPTMGGVLKTAGQLDQVVAIKRRARCRRYCVLQHLQHFDLFNCRSITDAGPASLAALKQLQHLNLGGCRCITDSGLASVVTLQDLRYLDLCHCEGITDAGPFGYLVALQHLQASCPKLLQHHGCKAL